LNPSPFSNWRTGTGAHSLSSRNQGVERRSFAPTAGSAPSAVPPAVAGYRRDIGSGSTEKLTMAVPPPRTGCADGRISSRSPSSQSGMYDLECVVARGLGPALPAALRYRCPPRGANRPDRFDGSTRTFRRR
jgi:hypothetical protein